MKNLTCCHNFRSIAFAFINQKVVQDTIFVTIARAYVKSECKLFKFLIFFFKIPKAFSIFTLPIFHLTLNNDFAIDVVFFVVNYFVRPFCKE